jgi:hypothetical protein
MSQTKLLVIASCCLLTAWLARGAVFAQSSPPTENKETNKKAESELKPIETSKRVELNLLGKTDASSGESRRNENVQFNLVDNGALKELNIRLGTTATIVREFAVANSYFGAEFGNAPKSTLALPGALKKSAHGDLRWAHLNSLFSARSFFQVGGVKPARENEYGFNFGAPLWKNAKLFLDAGQQKVRGSVNGNVLVPKPDERTPLASDPATRAIVARFLAAYPAELPNRTDINERALNTNAPQTINGNQAQARVDQQLNKRDQLTLQYQLNTQNVDAFQFVKGQNPNTDTKAHTARLVWTRQWNPTTVSYLSAAYERVTSLLEPERNAVGPFVLVSGLTFLGPDGSIPIDRAQNNLRYAGQTQQGLGKHNLTYGFGVVRRQLNGRETDVHRGFFSFNNDFLDEMGKPRSAITNLRLGTATMHLTAIGNVHRGFRYWDFQFYAGDNWQANSRLSLQYGLRYQPATRPVEVNGFNQLAYDSDLNNLAPSLGFAYRLPQRAGVLRAAYGVQFGEIFPVTFQQIRFTPPHNNKLLVTAPDLVNPLGSLGSGGQAPIARPTIYALDPELAVPYAHQYNLSWEPEWLQSARLQFGYVGSRAHKLFVLWYLNRAHVVPGIEQNSATIPLRRPNKEIAELRLVVNGSRGYFDAARVSLVLPGKRGLTMDVSYWFSKAIDLGANYTNTANENDSRQSRSQFEYENHRDMKGLSAFDQTHALLWRTSYTLPALPDGRAWQRWTNRLLGGWNLATVVLVKTGIPFNVQSGSDGPGFGNVDGSGSDRPHLLNPSILGRTIANPDSAKLLLPREAFAFIEKTEPRGNLGRNVFRKGPIHNVNASLTRVWGLTRDLKLSLRAESINLFNTPQFAEPGFELANPNFGAITNTLNDGRTFRFSLQIGW